MTYAEWVSLLFRLRTNLIMQPCACICKKNWEMKPSILDHIYTGYPLPCLYLWVYLKFFFVCIVDELICCPHFFYTFLLVPSNLEERCSVLAANKLTLVSWHKCCYWQHLPVAQSAHYLSSGTKPWQICAFFFSCQLSSQHYVFPFTPLHKITSFMHNLYTVFSPVYFLNTSVWFNTFSNVSSGCRGVPERGA